MKRSLLSTFILIGSSCLNTAHATCLDDVASFAKKICGDIQDSGVHTVVNADGKVEAGVSNIINRVVGGAQANVNGHVLEDTFKGVAQSELAGQNFNVITCKTKMVEATIKQVCNSPPEHPLVHYTVCIGEHEVACPASHDIFYTCGYFPPDDQIASNLCKGLKSDTWARLNTTAGGACGYGIIGVTCYPK